MQLESGTEALNESHCQPFLGSHLMNSTMCLDYGIKVIVETMFRAATLQLLAKTCLGLYLWLCMQTIVLNPSSHYQAYR